MTDIVDAIDQAISCQRDGCTQPITNSVSDDFCSQDCQTTWYAERSEPLVGYQEPYDLAVHYSHEPAFAEGTLIEAAIAAAQHSGLVWHDNSPETALARRVRRGYQEFLGHMARNYSRVTTLTAAQQVAEEFFEREPRYVQHLNRALELNLRDQAQQQNLMIIAWDKPQLRPRGTFGWYRDYVMIAIGVPRFDWPVFAPGGPW